MKEFFVNSYLKIVSKISIMKVFIFCAIILIVSNVNGSPSAKVLRSHRPPAGKFSFEAIFILMSKNKK